MEKQVPKFDSI